MQIQEKSVVSLSYVLKNDSAKGEIIEQTRDNDPLVFIYGIGQMLPKFEEYLLNLSIGDNFEFTLPSADAYGETDHDAIVDLDKSIFMFEGKVDEELIRIGNMIPMRDEQGNMLQGTVVAVTDNAVRMDFNHPMSGKTLHFTGKVLDVRQATDDELSHGHVHGDGGVHH